MVFRRVSPMGSLLRAAATGTLDGNRCIEKNVCTSRVHAMSHSLKIIYLSLLLLSKLSKDPERSSFLSMESRTSFLAFKCSLYSLFNVY